MYVVEGPGVDREDEGAAESEYDGYAGVHSLGMVLPVDVGVSARSSFESS